MPGPGRPKKDPNDKTPPKKVVRLNRKNTDFILSKIREGFTLPEIYKKWPEQCPKTHIWLEWLKRAPELNQAYEIARQDAIMNILDRCQTIVKERHLKPHEIDKKYECQGDKTLIKHYSTLEANTRKELIKTLIDAVRHYAPSKTQNVKVEGKGDGTIAVLDYSSFDLKKSSSSTTGKIKH